MKDICIMLATFNRTDCALKTISSNCEKLKYAGTIHWYLADAGSTEEHHKACKEELAKYGALIVGEHNVYCSPGHNWNAALKFIYERYEYSFRLEDDFVLGKELDITPYVTALEEKPEWGIVRLGLLPINLNCFSVGHNGIHYLQMYRNMQYAYSGNPLIMHKRFWDHYGVYPVDLSPGDTELGYDAKFRARSGPEIVWPVDLGGWSVFQHIGERKSI